MLVDTDKRIRAAGGFIVQPLPGAPDDLIGRLEENITLMDRLTTILDEDGDEAVTAQVLRGLEPRVLSREAVEYRCYCDRERVAEALMSIGAEAIPEMAASGESTEAECQFCSANIRLRRNSLPRCCVDPGTYAGVLLGQFLNLMLLMEAVLWHTASIKKLPRHIDKRVCYGYYIYIISARLNCATTKGASL